MKRADALILSVFFTVAASAKDNSYPQRPIRLIVPYPAGGPNDIFGRIIGQKLSTAFGQQVVVDNRVGASGIIGTELAARAPADGYTLLFGGAATLATNPALRAKLPYDPIRDFTPVSMVGTASLMLVTTNALPVRNVQDLIAHAKTHPGQINFASGGFGGPSHLASELLMRLAGINMLHVPYGGDTPSLVATMAGQVQIFFPGMSSALPLVADGKLRGLAVTGLKRAIAVPEMPTIAESGVPGYEFITWFAIVAPAATPRTVIERINTEIVKALDASDIKKRFSELAAEPVSSTPEVLGEYNRAELAKWLHVIKAAGIKAE